jgi:hypothetical protein
MSKINNKNENKFDAQNLKHKILTFYIQKLLFDFKFKDPQKASEEQVLFKFNFILISIIFNLSYYVLSAINMTILISNFT